MGSIPFNLPRVMVTSVVAAALAVGAVTAEVAAAGPAAAKTGPELAFTPSPDDFGAVATGQAELQTLTLANSGGSTARMLTVVLSGPAAFAITADTCAGTSLGPGKSCTVTVQFAPSSTGTVTATLTAASKKSGVSVTDALTGTGAPGANLYWANVGAFPNTGTIMKANLDGTGVTTIVTGQNNSYGVAVGASHIYWSDDSGPTDGAIMSSNLDGTGVTTLVTGQNGPDGMAVDASHVYWSDAVSGTIMAANLDGTGVTTLVTGLSAPQNVTVDSSRIYWAEDVQGGAGPGTIMAANLDGTGVTTLVPGQDQPEGVAVDATHVYWSDGDIHQSNLDGTNPHSLISGLNFGFAGLAIGPQ